LEVEGWTQTVKIGPELK